MAKDPKSSDNKRKGEKLFEGRSRDELFVDLGLDELTRELCVRDLFGELYADIIDEYERIHGRAPFDGAGGRVIQMGPGRRTPPDESESDDADPT